MVVDPERRLYSAGTCANCPFRASSLFGPLPDEEWRRFLALRIRHDHQRDNILFYDGNPPTGLFFLCRGRVKIVRSNCGNRQQIVRILSAPDFVGLRALLASAPYAGQAVVMQDSRLCLVPAAAFWRFVRGSPHAALALARRLAGQLGEAETMLTSLSLRKVRERVAAALLEHWARRAAQWAMMPESRHELAETLGTSVQAVCRAFAEFQSRGWVDVQGRRLRVRDEARLRAIAYCCSAHQPRAGERAAIPA